jgi:hypothetical protein
VIALVYPHALCCVLCLHLQPSLLPSYLQIASRKLLLFHGRRSRQQRRLPNSSSSSGGLVVRLAELVNSPVMAELQEMLLLGPGAEQERDLYNNWFSLQVGGRRWLGASKQGASVLFEVHWLCGGFMHASRGEGR